jgi:hypothetical protein
MKLLKWLFGSRKPALNKPVVSGSSVGFKKSPHHDKERIIAILDDLEPDKMVKLVDFLNDLGY